MALLGGQIFISLNAGTLSAAGEFTIQPGANQNTMLIGHTQVDGHKSMVQAAGVEGEIRVLPDTDVKAILSVSGATVVIRFNNGQSFSVADAVQTGSGEMKTEEATLAVKFEGVVGSFVSA